MSPAWAAPSPLHRASLPATSANRHRTIHQMESVLCHQRCRRLQLKSLPRLRHAGGRQMFASGLLGREVCTSLPSESVKVPCGLRRRLEFPRCCSLNYNFATPVVTLNAQILSACSQLSRIPSRIWTRRQALVILRQRDNRNYTLLSRLRQTIKTTVFPKTLFPH